MDRRRATPASNPGRDQFYGIICQFRSEHTLPGRHVRAGCLEKRKPHSGCITSAREAKPTASQKSLLVIGIAIILAHFLAAADVLPWHVLIFMIGLLQQVFIAALNFVLLLFPVDDSH